MIKIIENFCCHWKSCNLLFPSAQLQSWNSGLFEPFFLCQDLKATQSVSVCLSVFGTNLSRAHNLYICRWSLKCFVFVRQVLFSTFSKVLTILPNVARKSLIFNLCRLITLDHGSVKQHQQVIINSLKTCIYMFCMIRIRPFHVQICTLYSIICMI